MILLFDVDGVLIENQAYRAALRQTVAYFARRLGLTEVRLTDADIEVFESQSITVEWDSGAICAAALLVERLKATPGVSLPPDLGGAFDQLAAQPIHLPQPDFGALARRVGAATPPGGLPSRAALELFRAEAPEATPVLTHLLGDCYSIDRAPAMQIFQNYALGHQLYAEYYGLPAQVEGEPLLEKLDKSYLKAEMRDQLLARRTAGEAFPALYTARPSLAPIESGRTPRGYTPEAEIARKIAGLDPAPVMGFGKVDWLARRTGYIGADLVKPSPVQSIAAIAAARTGLETESLKAALAAVRGDHLRYPLTACKGETVHIFEDSASSLRAVTRAVELLNHHGLNVRLVRHGVGPRGSPKRDTLVQAADVLHEDVNEGLAQVLST